MNKVFLYLLCFDLIMNLMSKDSQVTKPADQGSLNNSTHSTSPQTPEYNQENYATSDKDEEFQNTKNIPTNSTDTIDPITENDELREAKLNQIPYFITIQYCNKSNLHTTFLNLQRTIYITYPKTRIEINSLEFPVPQEKKQLAQFVTYAQYGVAAFLFFFKQAFAYMGKPVPDIINKIADKKMFVLMFLFMFGGQIQNYLLSTGGFRVIVDDQMAYESYGQVVSFDQILEELKKYIKE